MVKLKLKPPAGAYALSQPGTPGTTNSPTRTPTTPIVPKIRLKPPTASTPLAPRATKVTKPRKPKLRLTTSEPTAAALYDHATNLPVKTPKLKLKTNGVPRPRKRHFEPGLGYDSEASDREDDPAIEEQFILRMAPGDDCEYLRQVIEERKLDTTTDVFVKFKDQRKAVVGVRGNLYAALLVDLPCIVESSKSLDKKHIFKTADICQMLIVGERIATEDAIHTIYHHPSETIFPHGLTPPLQYVRQRRFRKRVSNRTIEAVEAEVNRLLDADASAEGTWYEVLNAEELLREGEGGYDMLGEAGGDGEEGEEGGWTDAEGVEDYDMVDTVVEDGEDDELALHLESALMEAGEGDGEVGEADMLAALRNLAETDVANVEEEEESDEDEDEDAEGELDEAALEVAQQKQKLMEEIADLQAAFLAQQAELGKAQNPIIKARKQTALDRIKNELEFKRNSLLDAGGSL